VLSAAWASPGIERLRMARPWRRFRLDTGGDPTHRKVIMSDSIRPVLGSGPHRSAAISTGSRPEGAESGPTGAGPAAPLPAGTPIPPRYEYRHGLRGLGEQLRHAGQVVAASVTGRGTSAPRQQLLDRGLRRAAEQADAAAVLHYRQQGADPNSLSRRGDSALHRAIRADSPEAVEALVYPIDQGTTPAASTSPVANVNLRDAAGLTPLHIAVAQASAGSPRAADIVSIMASAAPRLDLHARAPDGRTGLTPTQQLHQHVTALGPATVDGEEAHADFDREDHAVLEVPLNLMQTALEQAAASQQLQQRLHYQFPAWHAAAEAAHEMADPEAPPTPPDDEYLRADTANPAPRSQET